MLMNPKTKKLLGGSFALIGLGLGIYFGRPVELSRDPGVWFSPAYYTQFIPVYIAISLLLSGVFMLIGYRGVNVYLAVFGHTASEEVIFDWIGWTNSSLPPFATAVFFPLSLVTLWMAYFNVLGKRRLSIPEAIFGLVVSTVFILAPRAF